MIYRDKDYVEQLHPRLIEICTLLNEVHMTDDDCDLVACSFRDTEWRRCVYVYLEIEGLDIETDDLEKCEIKYDFEDHKSKSSEWDMAVERGVVKDKNNFREKVYAFLGRAT